MATFTSGSRRGWGCDSSALLDYSAHSFRSGFMTEARRQNVPLGEAMALTGYRSVQTAVRYFQAGAVEKSQAGNLLGSGSREGK
jgi:hypothetical protein